MDCPQGGKREEGQKQTRENDSFIDFEISSSWPACDIVIRQREQPALITSAPMAAAITMQFEVTTGDIFPRLNALNIFIIAIGTQ